jgi:hypothetical protein
MQTTHDHHHHHTMSAEEEDASVSNAYSNFRAVYTPRRDKSQNSLNFHHYQPPLGSFFYSDYFNAAYMFVKKYHERRRGCL